MKSLCAVGVHPIEQNFSINGIYEENLSVGPSVIGTTGTNKICVCEESLSVGPSSS